MLKNVLLLFVHQHDLTNRIPMVMEKSRNLDGIVMEIYFFNKKN